MHRYVKDGDVWEIASAGKQLRIVENGAPTVRTFRSVEHAAAQLEKAVADKLAAGFESVALDPREPALEAAILADPENLTAYEVYGDWLQAHGDPRGALIALQLAARRGDTKLEAAAKKHLDAHADYLLGELAAAPADAFTWSRGFVDKIYLSAGGWLGRALAHPSCRFAAEISVVGDAHAADAIAMLAEHAPPTLRALRLRNIWQHDLGVLWPAMPRLRRLTLVGERLALGDLAALPHLERLEYADRAMPYASMHAIATAPWRELRELRIDFGSNEVTGEASIDDVFALLGRRDLPSLVRVGLIHTRYARELVIELVASPLALQLEALDLSHNQLTDVHAIELARHKDRFAKLQQLDVSGNRLSDAGLAALGTLVPKLRALRQDGRAVI
jgi:uncharacterized protein (TIGR02996 family)